MEAKSQAKLEVHISGHFASSSAPYQGDSKRWRNLGAASAQYT